MRTSRLVPILLAGAAVLVTGPSSARGADDADGTDTRAFVLDNGMEVLLTSDPSADRSAAALAVHVGSMDNGDRSGIAHFLEHMLFLGTAKYPDSADYKDYLAQNDGMSNAYTSDDHTNYFFEVRNEAFEGALDRFSRFFIDPLMTDALSAREVNAVDSEHSKNLENDFWRTRQVYRSLLNPAHPHRGFSTGNRETLAGVKNEVLRAFYEEHYSANLMHLALVSPLPIETLEAWVRARFAEVPNRGIKALAVDVPLWDDTLRGKILSVESVQDVHQLWVRFQVPDSALDHQTKPGSILGAILGHEGSESLLQDLKRGGLATSLSAGLQTIGAQGTFGLTLGLTPEGTAQVDTVLERVFGMINHLRALPEIPQYVIEQRQKMAEIELRFRQAGRISDEARFRAATMIHYPHDDLLPSIYLIPAPSQESIREVLDAMTPDNALVVHYARGRETDQVEQYYKAPYSVRAFGDEGAAKLASAKPAPGVGLPGPNAFVPSDFSLVEPTHTDAPWVQPFAFGEAWLRHDTQFGQPKAAFEVAILNEKNSRSVRDFVLGNLYAAAVQLAMNPHSYPLNEAGVNLSVASERRGVTLSAGGFSHKLPELAAFALPFLKELRIDEAQFAVLQEQYARGLANAAKAPPTTQAFEIFRQLVREVHFTAEEQAEALAGLTRTDLEAYFGRAHESVFMRGFFYGNMTEEAVQRTMETLQTGLAPKRQIADEERYQARVLRLAKGPDAIVRRPIESNDSVAMMLYQGDPATREERAALTLLGKAFPPGFYGDLRTLQQTGYIVQSGAFEMESLPLVFMLSQSSVVGTDSLRGRFVSHVAHFLNDLDDLGDDEFQRNREAAVAELSKKSTSYEEELARMVRLAVGYDDLQDDEKQVAAVRGLTRERWIEIARDFLTNDARCVSIQLDGQAERRRFQERDLDDLRKGADGYYKHPRGQDAE